MAERPLVSKEVAKDYPGTTKGVLGRLFHDKARSSERILQEFGVEGRTLKDLGFLLGVRSCIGLELFQSVDSKAFDSLDEVNEKIGKFEEVIVNADKEVREPIAKALVVFSRSLEASAAYRSSNDPLEVLNTYYEYGSTPSLIKR